MRSGALHVATTTRKYKGKVYQTHLLRRTYREDGKVKHQTLGNISHLPAELIDTIRRHLRGDASAAADAHFEILRSLPHGHVAAVLGTLRHIGLEELIGSRPSLERRLVTAMIVSRLLEPRSKLATSRGLKAESATSSLALELGIQLLDDRALYQAMDWLLKRQPQIEEKLAKTKEGILVVLDHFGIKARIETSVVDEGSYVSAGKKISTLLKQVASGGHSIDVDITPGRKALVSGLLMAISGSRIKVEHLFYLDIATIVNVNYPYDMIPKTMQTLRDFMHEFNNEFKEAGKHASEE